MSLMPKSFAGLAKYLSPNASASDENDDGVAVQLGNDDAGDDDATNAQPTPTASAPAVAVVDAPASASGYAAGVAAERVRWASILSNTNCQSNIELAAMLAMETDFDAEKIGSMCAVSSAPAISGNQPDPAAVALLERTTKPDVKPNANDGSEGADAGAEARKAATQAVNKDRGRRGK